MDEMHAVNAKSSEAISSTKLEIAGSRKELQTLSLELQGLVSAVSKPSISYLHISYTNNQAYATIFAKGPCQAHSY